VEMHGDVDMAGASPGKAGKVKRTTQPLGAEAIGFGWSLPHKAEVAGVATVTPIRTTSPTKMEPSAARQEIEENRPFSWRSMLEHRRRDSSDSRRGRC
jgi:hypothetical protein